MELPQQSATAQEMILSSLKLLRSQSNGVPILSINRNSHFLRPERNLMITTNALPAPSRKGRLITLWTLSGLLALAFIGAGGGKSAGVPVMIEMFGKVGLGQWFRYFTGLLEVAGGIGFLVSRYPFSAAARRFRR